MTEQGKYPVKVSNFRPYITLSTQFLGIMIDTAKNVMSSLHAPADFILHTHGELIKLETELNLRN
jgi:hypothetical protein